MDNPGRKSCGVLRADKEFVQAEQTAANSGGPRREFNMATISGIREGLAGEEEGSSLNPT